MPDRAGVNVETVKVQLMQKFGFLDYAVFLLMLSSCSLIGVYFGFFAKKDKKSTGQDDYLVGGRTMKVFPVAMSLIASYISGISLLGTPTEIYIYGTQYMYIIGGILTMGIVMQYVYLPVFHDLKLTSTYHYLAIRFDQRIRLFGSILFAIGMVIWLPIVIFVPALAFNQVTGVNIHLVTPIVCIVCIFYTCVGGMKAVVWTDVVQTWLMFGSMLIVIIKGTLDVGGLSVVLDRAMESGRIEAPDTRLDLTIRHSVISLVIGGFPYWLKTNAVSQNMIQRYLSLPTKKSAIKALWIFIFGVFILISLCCYSGLLIFAMYHECDPLTTKLARAKDQLLPLLVLDVLGNYPGLPGIFVAGVFSAALSSLSTGLNSMSAVVYEDFFKAFSKKEFTERQTHFIMRGIVVVFGSICVALVFVVEHLGSVLQLSMSLGAISNGPLLGIFTIGILMPWVHGTGCLWGGISGLASMAWLVTKAQTAIRCGELYFEPKPVSVQGCSYTYFTQPAMSMLAPNVTLPTTTEMPDHSESGTEIYHVSYLFYTLIGASVTIIVATIVSFLVGANKVSDMDENHFATFIRPYIRRKQAEANPTQPRKAQEVLEIKEIVTST